MNIRRMMISMPLAATSLSVLAQQPVDVPCIDNPLIWERRAGPAQPPDEVSVVVSEGMRTLRVISVAELIEQLPNEPSERTGPICSSAIERTVGGFFWLVSECGDLADEMTILAFEPGRENPNSLRFTVTLLDLRCRVDTNASLDEPGQRSYADFQRMTRAELDQLVLDVRANIAANQ